MVQDFVRTPKDSGLSEIYLSAKREERKAWTAIPISARQGAD